MTRKEFVEKLEEFKNLIDNGTIPYETYPKEVVSLIFDELICDANNIEPFYNIYFSESKLKELCKESAERIFNDLKEQRKDGEKHDD